MIVPGIDVLLGECTRIYSTSTTDLQSATTLETVDELHWTVSIRDD
jgi:hypothetical protein